MAPILTTLFFVYMTFKKTYKWGQEMHQLLFDKTNIYNETDDEFIKKLKSSFNTKPINLYAICHKIVTYVLTMFTIYIFYYLFGHTSSFSNVPHLFV